MRVLLANPRGFCAGVERAVDIVEAALAKFGPPIYVRHEIVHNHFVLATLRQRGAVFVEELSDVPEGATVIFSAHGVSPSVFREAVERQLTIVDATCPLVTKVHLEVAKHSGAGSTVFLIGHRGHPEVIGTMGHGADRTIVVENEAEAESVVAPEPQNVAYATQTTLSVDATREIVSILKRRFPQLRGPHADDICYATQNRQNTVKALAEECDVIIVIGASHSSNSQRLREVAAEAGACAHLVDCAERVERSWFDHATTVGVTAGASAPEALVTQLITKFRAWWPDMSEESVGEPETLHFRMPSGLVDQDNRAAADLKGSG